MTVGITTDAVLSLGDDGLYDISLDNSGDIETEDFFDTSLLMSIYCERRALDSEVAVSEYRRGWIGNQGTGFEIGSKVWLYYQSRVTREVMNGVVTAIRNGLKWLTDDGIATNVEVSATLGNGSIGVTVDIQRPSSKVDRLYYDLWENTGIR